MSFMQSIRSHVEQLPAGAPFTSKELLRLAPRMVLDQALSRMVKAGFIVRVARGVFLRPIQSRYVGPVMPEPERVVQKIAAASGAAVEVHGAEAARRFGLTTQVPTQPVFNTSGPSRRFKLGKLEVTMRHVSPKKLQLAGRPAGVALSALSYLGKSEVTAEVVGKIKAALPESEFATLKEATTAMPGWLIDVLHHRREQPHG